MASMVLQDVEIGSPENLVVQIPSTNEPHERAIGSYAEYWKVKPKLSEPSALPTTMRCELLDTSENITAPYDILYELVAGQAEGQSTLPLPLRLDFRRAYKSFAFRVLLRLTPTDVRVVQFTVRVKLKPVVIKLAM